MPNPLPFGVRLHIGQHALARGDESRHVLFYFRVSYAEMFHSFLFGRAIQRFSTMPLLIVVKAKMLSK